jgi:3-methyladenine DNA glycosylase AlkC
MSTPLKDLYSASFYDSFSNILEEILPDFDKENFLALIFDETWKAKELKDRMRHTSRILHQFLPKDFKEAVGIILLTIEKIRVKNFITSSLEFMFFPDYVETYGITNFEHSVKVIEFVTQFTSCEFAVRPFIIQYGSKMLDQMHLWSKHENHHVRRLASEGSRPRLPWAMAIPTLKKDPKAILSILENLKTDPSEYVRRSVANSLNDIAKDNPGIVISIAKKWKGLSKETDGIVKHGCRTLLKQGHPEIMALYDLSPSRQMVISDFFIHTKKVRIGEDLKFSFSVQNSDKQRHSFRLEYAIYYLKQNGQFGKKVFKIKEGQIEPGNEISIFKKQCFKIITTRRFYEGKQKLSVILNGIEKEIIEFELGNEI